jgi:enamine deaminase RidA (YjgF/YER057c/UK114 family)
VAVVAVAVVVVCSCVFLTRVAQSFSATGNSADAFALFRTFQAAGAAVCFFISSSLSVDKGSTSTQQQLSYELVITAAIGYLAIMGHWLFSKFESRAAAITAADAAAAFSDAESQGVIANGFLYTAGCIGVRAGEVPSKHGLQSSMEAQTREACNNLKAILTGAGCSLKDVVKTTVYLADGSDEAEMVSFALRSAVLSLFIGSQPLNPTHVECAPPPRPSQSLASPSPPHSFLLVSPSQQ